MKSPNLVVVRHTNHIPSESDDFVEEVGLTRGGIDEARRVGRRFLQEGRSFDAIHSFDHLRALSTVSLEALPNMALDDLGKVTESGLVTIDSELDYINPPEGEFSDRLLESYLANRNFLFLFESSDEYNTREQPISSYSAMAAAAARLILQSMHSVNVYGPTTLACAREFVVPSFIGKILRNTKGEEREAEYVYAYAENIENTDASRTDVVAISSAERLINGAGYILRDDHDEYYFNSTDLHEILDEVIY